MWPIGWMKTVVLLKGTYKTPARILNVSVMGSDLQLVLSSL